MNILINAISIKEVKGKRKKLSKSKKRKKTPGNIRKKVNTRKQDYVVLTRKLRKYVSEMKKQGILNKEEIDDIRKKIRNKFFRSKAYLKEYIKNMRK